MNPLAILQALGWVRSNWRLIAAGAAAVAVSVTIGALKLRLDGATRRAADASAQVAQDIKTLKAVTADRDAAIANRDEFKAALAHERELATETAAARADERRQLQEIAAASSAAKEGIRNAPGASDSFVFSDAAYGVMRSSPPAAIGGDGQGSAAQTPAGVGGR